MESSVASESMEENNSRTPASDEDFLCSYCKYLMVQPTTLTCGHSFCRKCLANLLLKSRKTECHQCRNAWTGHPQINITLRNLSIRLFPDRVTARENEVLTDDAKSIIAQFDKELTKVENDQNGQSFFNGICFALTIIVVIYLAWYWKSSDADLLIHKPLTKWSVNDVDKWLTDMGSWTKEYIKVVREKKIGGNLMYRLDEDNIVNIFNITDPLHKNALVNSINIIKTRGVKPPSNLWEFKALYPGWALFLLYSVKDYPRSSLMYLYFFQHDTMFLPFVHTVCPIFEVGLKYDFTDIPLPLTLMQWTEFLPQFLFLPYALFGKFTWDWMDIHYWTSRFVLANCIAMTILEASYVVMYMMGDHQIGSLLNELKRMMKSFMSFGIFVLIWPLVPSFVCDCVFYIALYFSPYQVSRELFDLWRHH